MHLLPAVQFILLLFVLFVSKNAVHSEPCTVSNTSYTLCSSDGANRISNSNSFNEGELIEECHEHFIKKVLGKSCQHHETKTPPLERKKPTFVERYVYGFIAVFLISALSLVGLLALPILYKISFEYVLNFFTAIAVGTLFGDAMFHLIPFALGAHKHNHDNTHDDHDLIPANQLKMLLAVFVLYTFYLLEVFLHWFAHYKHDHSSARSHIHNTSQIISMHNHSNKTHENCQYTRVDVDLEHSHLHHNHTHHNLHQHLSKERNTPSICSEGNPYTNDSLPCTPCTYSNETHLTTNPFVQHDSSEKSEEVSIAPRIFTPQFSNQLADINPVVRQLKTIKSTGWMILFGDSIHNFADGLAIGAAFSQNPTLGITTTIAVACHELPHELGDYAVLLQSGFSHCRALLWNFLSATTAIIGFFIGARISDHENVRQWIFAATIGMFLYIALVDLLPTLLADGEFQLKRFIVVNCGFLFGIIVMFILALKEDDIIRSSFK